jgi:hypothetical protein
MAIKPKINTKEDVDKLSKCYLIDKMSTVDIEKNSIDIFGKYISRGTVYKSLVKHKINVRDKSTSVSRAMSTLDIDSSFINENKIEWIDGSMLGDGHINFKKHSEFQNSRIVIGTSSKQWAEFTMQELKDYDPCEPVVYQKIDKKHPNPIWESKTKTHPDIVGQAKRWYSGKNESKSIPKDVRITPTSVLLWYLGDGSFTYQSKINSGKIRLATCSFSNYKLDNILIPKLNSVGIKCGKDNSKNDITICGKDIKYFFNFIGWKSPFSDYDHKFDIPEWLKLYRLSEIVDNDRDKWRVQYWCKTGRVEFSKSPNGKFLLFSKGQVDRIKNKLSNNFP